MAARITQVATEAALESTSLSARLTQAVIEAAAPSSLCAARLTQYLVEVGVAPVQHQPFQEEGFTVVADKWL